MERLTHLLNYYADATVVIGNVLELLLKYILQLIICRDIFTAT